jgi:uncharacterized radical SAM superfamily protein
MRRALDCYYPGRGFPSISTTGTSCSLDCKHCAGRYLESMVPMTDPDELVDFARALAERGGKGFLLSGGCDPTGRVPLARFAPAIKEVKSTTGLKVNAHVGLTPKEELSALVGSGVDAFSVDVYGDDTTIREVLGLGAGPEDYISVVRNLIDLGAPVVAPHICLGIRGGELQSEHTALRLLEPLSPDSLVILSFAPTKGTAYASCGTPHGDAIISFVRAARSALPQARVLLGCMRSRRDRSWEADAISAGLDGIVLPSEDTVSRVSSMGIQVRRKETCCAIG